SQRVAVRGKKGNGSTALIEGVDQLQHPEHCARCVEDRHQEYRDGPVIETCIHVRVELVRPVRRNVIRVGHIQLSRREPDEAGDAALVQLKRFWEQLARQLALAVPPREGLVLDDREAKPVAFADVDRSAFGAREPPRLGEHTFENPREFFRCARDDSVVDVVLQERAPSARDLTVRLPPLDDVDLGSFGVDLREHASERRGVVVVALERLQDDRQRREPRYDPEARPQGDVVERGDVGGVGDGERHLVERPAVGTTPYLQAVGPGISLMISGAISSGNATSGMPYRRERKWTSRASAITPRRTRISPSFPPVRFCSASAWSNWSCVIRASETSRSPNRWVGCAWLGLRGATVVPPAPDPWPPLRSASKTRVISGPSFEPVTRITRSMTG